MTHPSVKLEQHYLAQNYAPLDVVLEKAEGCYVWDDKGKRYLDFLSAYSAVSFGHAHPEIINTLVTQAQKLDVVSRAFYADNLGPFARQLCTLTGMDAMLPMNTGAEAVETAIKAARRWGYQHKGIPADKAQIIVAEGNFHGRTSTIVGFSSDSDYKKDFGPFDGGFIAVPFGDAAALETAITPHTCAFLVEPMQGEGGIIVPPAGWLKQVQAICRRHNVLLILDEIQTGMGRTGKNFAFQHEIDRPDALLLGKALGGGVYPVSAFLAKNELMQVFTPGSHGSTFGGNPIACAVGQKALELLERLQLAQNSAVLGAYLQQEIRKINSPLVRQVRGAGLWVGIEIDTQKTTARAVCTALMAHGVLAKDTHGTVVRLAPPLVINKQQINTALQALRHVLALGS